MSDEVARILDQALDSIWRGKSTPTEWIERYPQYGDELRALLSTATHLKDLPLPEPDQEFRTHSRLRILRYISIKQNAAMPAVARRPARRRQVRPAIPMFRRTALSFAVVITLLVALLSTGTVYASNNSLPGDLLYPVKTTVEDVRLAAASDQQVTQLYLQFAERRVEEIELLVAKGRFELVPVAVARYEEQVQSAVAALPPEGDDFSEIDQEQIQAVMSQNQEALTKVLRQVPEPAQDAIQHAIEVSQQGQEKIKKAVPPRGKPTSEPGAFPEITPYPPALTTPQVEPTREVKPTKTPKATKTPMPTNTPKDKGAHDDSGVSPPGQEKDKPTHVPPALNAEKTDRQP